MSLEKKLRLSCILSVAMCAVAPLAAQSQPSMADMNDAGMFLMGLASGTSANPASWPMPMLMTQFGNWNTMFMGTAFVSDIQQSGPRGGDKLYSTNWFMASAEHRAGAKGAFETELMLSLEPATITDRRYPLLFQTGETAYGLPLTDAQHPHNFIMALGFHYVYQARRKHHPGCLRRASGRPGLGPDRLSASRLGRGIAGGAPLASLAGFHAHRRRRGRRWASRTRKSSWRPAASMAPSRARIVGSSRRARSTHGPRACGFSRRRIGRRRFRSAGSRIPKRWNRATRCAAPHRWSTPSRCPAEPGRRA